MPTCKFDTDAKGDFLTKKEFKRVTLDLDGPAAKKKAFIKLIQPRDAHIKGLTITINRKTINVNVSTGKIEIVGPFPLVAGDNQLKLEGRSDKPSESHEISVTPQLLK